HPSVRHSFPTRRSSDLVPARAPGDRRGGRAQARRSSATGERISGSQVLTAALTFLVALATIAVLMRIVKYTSFLPFAIYRVLLRSEEHTSELQSPDHLV